MSCCGGREIAKSQSRMAARIGWLNCTREFVRIDAFLRAHDPLRPGQPVAIYRTQ